MGSKIERPQLVLLLLFLILFGADLFIVLLRWDGGGVVRLLLTSGLMAGVYIGSYLCKWLFVLCYSVGIYRGVTLLFTRWKEGVVDAGSVQLLGAFLLVGLFTVLYILFSKPLNTHFREQRASARVRPEGLREQGKASADTAAG